MNRRRKRTAPQASSRARTPVKNARPSKARALKVLDIITREFPGAATCA